MKLKKIMFGMIFLIVVMLIYAASPVTNSVTTTPTGNINDSDDIQGLCNITDSDGDLQWYEWKWYKNGAEFTSGTVDNATITSDTSETSNSHLNVSSGACLGSTYSNGFDNDFGTSITISGNGVDYTGGCYITENYDYTTDWGDNVSFVYLWSGHVDAQDTLLVYARNHTLGGLQLQEQIDGPISAVNRSFSINTVAYGINQTAGSNYFSVQFRSTGLWSSNYYEGTLESTKYNPIETGINYNLANISNSNTTPGDTFIFSCRGYDGSSYSNWTNSSTVTVVNNIPVIAEANITVDSIYTFGNLTGYCNATDIDSHTINYTWTWYNDSMQHSTGSSGFLTEGVRTNVANISSTSTTKNEVWTLGCIADDSYNRTGETNSSVTIQNSLPSISGFDISSSDSSNLTNTTLSYSYTFSDSDSDIDSSIFEWYENSTLIYSGSAYNLSADNVSKGNTYYLNITPNDGEENGNMVQSTSSFLILNTPPVIEDVLIVEPVLNTFNCTYIYSDADSDTDVSTFRWYKNNIFQNITDQNWTYSLQVGENLSCGVTGNDNEVSIVEVNSSYYTTNDSNAPNITYFNVPSSGTNEESLTFTVTCVDDNQIATGFPKLQYLDPNSDTQGNFTMTLDAGNNYTVSRILSTVGSYTNFTTFCRDGNGNEATNQSNVTLVISSPEAPPAPGGGGGGGDDDGKKDCNFEVDPSPIIFNAENDAKKIEIKNNEESSITPTYTLRGGSSENQISDVVKIASEATIIQPKSLIEASLILLTLSGNETELNGNLEIGSDNCNTKIFPIEIDLSGALPNVPLGQYFSGTFIKIGDFELKNYILTIISAILGTIMAFSIKKIAVASRIAVGIFFTIIINVVLGLVFTII